MSYRCEVSGNTAWGDATFVGGFHARLCAEIHRELSEHIKYLPVWQEYEEVLKRKRIADANLIRPDVDRWEAAEEYRAAFDQMNEVADGRIFDACKKWFEEAKVRYQDSRVRSYGTYAMDEDVPEEDREAWKAWKKEYHEEYKARKGD